jgi:hypothetical protein
MGNANRIFYSLLGLFALFLSSSVQSFAGEIKVKALLVWGTDEKKPAGKDYKQIPEDWRERLRALRWKNYYIVKDQTVEVAKNPAKFDLSERCTVSLKIVGDQLEAQVFNPKASTPESPVIGKKISLKELKEGYLTVLGGDSKDRWDDSWAVLIVAAD